MKALQALQNEPIPEKSAQNCESGKEMDDDKDANKSEISLVFEIALKRNMPVSFEVIKESGPPHMKSFVTRVSVGEFSAEGEGNSKNSPRSALQPLCYRSLRNFHLCLWLKSQNYFLKNALKQ